jgi:citrate synthase
MRGMEPMDKQAAISTAISEVHPDRVVVRGHDLCRDLIGKTTLTEYFLLLLTGTKPSAQLVAVTDAAIVAIAEHGLTPSVQAARMTLFAEPQSMQSAVAAGILGCGSVILGAAEVAGKLLLEVLAEGGKGNLEAAAAAALRQLRQSGQTVPGFGHPIHRAGDPRTARLLELARELGLPDRHVQALHAIERQMEGVYGRRLVTNVSAAIAAVLLDAGFPPEALKGVPLLGRCAALIAHLEEERQRRIGYRLAEQAVAGLKYDGPAVQ